MEWFTQVLFVLPNWAWIAIGVAVLLLIIIIAACIAKAKKKKAVKEETENTPEPVKADKSEEPEKVEPVTEEKAVQPAKEEAAVTESVKEEEKEQVEEESKKAEEKPAAKTQTKKPAPVVKTVNKTPVKPSKPPKTAAQTTSATNDNKVYHISKRKDDGRWQIKAEGGSRAIKLFATQAEAIEFAKTLADNQDARIMIHKEDGSFRKLTYKKN